LAIRLLAVASHAGPELSSEMSAPYALSALAALGQATRLSIFKLLMESEPRGLAAGAIAEALSCQQNTLSVHLGILARAGLIVGVREGRSIIYRADVQGMRALLAFLVTDCCDGHPELCGFLGLEPKKGCGCSTGSASKENSGCGSTGSS
jgi:ArsR family transcriptional regulator, arsenate/arsenite/antimonite-responsive transcriptional repressor